MASDGRRANRPYRKASEYLGTRQTGGDRQRTLNALELENGELREKLTTSVRRLEAMEVEFEQSREYFSTQLDITTDRLNRTTQSLKVMQQSYNELQNINYGLEQRLLKVTTLENERSQLTSEVNELINRLTDTRNSLQQTQKENERLRKDCNLAVSLLECNAGNFKQQRPSELPRDLQNRVEEYQLDAMQYNEYINPYADDSESDGEEMPKQQQKQQYREISGAVPVELLANVLKKPENVHMKLEDTDYIRDPDLNAVYKGQIAEKKLVKHDYSPSYYGQSATMPRLGNTNSMDVTKSHSSSPWEMAPAQPPSGGNSPWEMAPTVTETSSGGGSPWEMAKVPPSSAEYDVDDYGSASAYGAYPVSQRNVRPKAKPALKVPPQYSPTPGGLKKSMYAKTKMSSSYNAATTYHKKTQKGIGENQDVYISENFQQQDGGSEQSIRSSGSGQSSQKSTPGKVQTGTERGTSGEKSSLLDEEEDDDMVMTVEVGGKGPVKVGMESPNRQYRIDNSGGEGRGLLRRDSPEPDERDLDQEEGGKMRESYDYEEDGDDMRESFEHEITNSNMREPLTSELPNINLLNLDENAPVMSSNENSPLHEIVMKQTMLRDVTMMKQSGLLPELPPPSEPSYGNEMILPDSMPVPPPPDMFGGAPSYFTAAPPMPPGVINQSNPVRSVPPLPEPVMSDPLGDLTVMVKQEFESAQSPKKTAPVASVEGSAPSSVQQQSPSTEQHQIVNEEPPEAFTASSGLEKGTSEELNNREVVDVSPPVGDVQQAVNSGEVATECLAEPGGPEEVTSSGDGEELSSHNEQSISNLEQNSEVNSDLTETLDTEQYNSPLDGVSVDQQDVGDDTVTEDLQNEPLEVVELQEEPRGGGGHSGRIRRSSFERARQYGNVMSD